MYSGVDEAVDGETVGVAVRDIAWAVAEMAQGARQGSFKNG
jgi:hypothetical protein